MSHPATFPSLRGPKSVLGPKYRKLSFLCFRRCLWFSPALFAVHALEDAPSLADWMRRTQLFEPVSRGQLIVALVLLFALSCLCSYAAYNGNRWGVYALVWMQGLIFLHGVSHLIPSVWLLAYTPGFVTGALLLPLSYYVYRNARNFYYFGRKTAFVLLIAAVLMYDPVLRLAFMAGYALIHEQHRPEPSPDRVPGARDVI